MLSNYTVQIDETGNDGYKHFVVSVAFDEAAWDKRRSTDGFVLLVAHADLPQSAAEMVALQRAKETRSRRTSRPSRVTSNGARV